MATGLNGLMDALIVELEKLPGLGKRSAERIAYHLLVNSSEDALALAKSIEKLKASSFHCEICYNISDQNPCSICSDENRDNTLLCVVEQPRDLIKIERSGFYKGHYHILHGNLAPLDGVTEDHLTLKSLNERLKNSSYKEVIIATSANLEGETTALHLQDLLQNFSGKVTRIARGLPTGTQIEFASEAMLHDALRGRQTIHESQAKAQTKKRKGQAATEYLLILSIFLISFFLWNKTFTTQGFDSLFDSQITTLNQWWQWPIP